MFPFALLFGPKVASALAFHEFLPGMEKDHGGDSGDGVSCTFICAWVGGLHNAQCEAEPGARHFIGMLYRYLAIIMRGLLMSSRGGAGPLLSKTVHSLKRPRPYLVH